MLTRNWATELEYRYSQYGSQTVGGVNMTPSTHTIRLGLAYKFGVGADNKSVGEAGE